ncbi:MAG TPA: YIP1 family protein [Candidatus Nanoarchaeia archaeon]|nr:YIP1 family protein [Candidatus Nanoarchaeia archaeon]
MAKKEASQVSIYSNKLKNLFFHPNAFFKSVEKESNYWQILMFYFLFSVSLSVLGLIISLPSLQGEFRSAFFIIFTILLIIISAFISPFIIGAIIHLGVLIFGGRNGFFNTFKPITYASVIGLFYSFLSDIIFAVINIFNPVDLSSLEANPLAIFTGAFSLSLGLSLLILLVSFVHILIVSIVGVSKFQKFSYGRAFLAVIIIPALLLALFLIMGAAVLLSLFAGLRNI